MVLARLYWVIIHHFPSFDTYYFSQTQRKHKYTTLGQKYRQGGEKEMSMIPCTQNCVYQKDGLCALKQAMSTGYPDSEHPCVNYVPALDEGRQRLPYVPHRNEL